MANGGEAVINGNDGRRRQSVSASFLLLNTEEEEEGRNRMRGRKEGRRDEQGTDRRIGQRDRKIQPDAKYPPYMQTDSKPVNRSAVLSNKRAMAL